MLLRLLAFSLPGLRDRPRKSTWIVIRMPLAAERYVVPLPYSSDLAVATRWLTVTAVQGG